MFKNIESLQYSKHQDLRLSKVDSFAFTGNVSVVKLSFSELRGASRYFPIVFLKDAPGIPQALLSLTSGKNDFVDEKGNWKVPYIPAYFRMYPFVLGKVQEQEQEQKQEQEKNTKEQFALCLDPKAAHFKSGMGEPLFTADGKPADLIQNILKSLETYQKELMATQALFKGLDEKGLIVDRAFKYRVGQKEKRIDGFKGVDMEKLLGLDDKSLADMVKNGTIGLIHEHTLSLSNFSKFLAAPQLKPR